MSCGEIVISIYIRKDFSYKSLIFVISFQGSKSIWLNRIELSEKLKREIEKVVYMRIVKGDCPDWVLLLLKEVEMQDKYKELEEKGFIWSQFSHAWIREGDNITEWLVKTVDDKYVYFNYTNMDSFTTYDTIEKFLKEF